MMTATLPSEYSDRVTEFTNARWAEFEEALNGDDIPAWAEQGFKMLLRGQGYLHADLQAHINDEEMHAGGSTGASRKRQAGVVGVVSGVVVGIVEGLRRLASAV